MSANDIPIDDNIVIRGDDRYLPENVEPSGSGHTIIDGSGTSMTQRTGLQFEGAEVTDDSSNDRTIVSVDGYVPGDAAETTIDDADYFPFYDTSATAKKKSLWSNIKDKIIAALVPHYWRLSGEVTTIPASSTNTVDLNTYTTPGNYTCTASANSPYVTNQPLTSSQKAFNMVVIKNLNSNTYLRQILWYHDENVMYSRVTQNAGSSWGAWFNMTANTTYTFATGDANGQIKVTPSSGTAQNVSVKGLGSSAYESADTSATASTVVKRSSSGYIYGTYINASNGALNPASYTSYAVFQDSDGWFRKSTKANFQTWLGLGSNAYTSTSYLPIAGGTMTGALNVDGNFKSSTTIQGATGLLAGAHSAVINGTTYSQAGYVRVYGASGTYYAAIKPNTMTSDIDIQLPKTAGTLALTSNLSSYVPKAGGDMTGKLSSSSTIQVVGAIASGCGSFTVDGTTYTNQAGYLRVFDSAAHYASIVANSNMTANRTITLPSTTGTLSYSSSSHRVKKNIRDMTEEEAKKLLDIDIIKFDYKEFWNDGEKNQSGLIAEDVIKIIPEAVHIGKNYDPNAPVDENYNFPPEVNYTKFVPYLIKMIQIQEQRINELEAEIQVLKEG